ncbi:MAG: alpha-N-arabinofuranosidase, partial [Oscillospiraceae bacterium]|nr:alpha-N-arabinofuranosidase [Oscillospiraceae bacterium]
VPAVEAIAVENGGEITVLAVNRSLEEDAELELDLQGWGGLKLLEHSQLFSEDLKAVNTADDPERVKPEPGDGKTLRRHSWNLLRYEYGEN